MIDGHVQSVINIEDAFDFGCDTTAPLLDAHVGLLNAARIPFDNAQDKETLWTHVGEHHNQDYQGDRGPRGSESLNDLSKTTTNFARVLCSIIEISSPAIFCH